MDQNKHIVKHDRYSLILRTVFAGVFTVVGIYYIVDSWKDNGTGWKIGMLVFIAILLIFFNALLRQLYRGDGEIILTKEGIEICGTGMYTWEFIDSFSTIEYYDPYSISVVLHFKDFTDVKFTLDGLDTDINEIIKLIQVWKGDAQLYYKEHTKK